MDEFGLCPSLQVDRADRLSRYWLGASINHVIKILGIFDPLAFVIIQNQFMPKYSRNPPYFIIFSML